MAKRGGNIVLNSYDDLFETQQSKDDAEKEKVDSLLIDDLHSFKHHPFKVLDNEEMNQMVESVQQFGILNPLIVRPDENGTYEIVSGHRRARAAELAGLTTVPAIVRQLDDDAAIILMVDSNLARENILPSEKAWSYKLKLDAMKRQAGRPSKDNLSQVGTQKRSDQLMAEEVGESRNQIQRYIRLTNLIPELLDMVDAKQISFNPAVELSYLKPFEQTQFISAMEYGGAPPTLSQAQRIKRLSQDGHCGIDAMCAIMSEEKKVDMDKVTIKPDVLKKYFPKSYTPKQMEDTIIKLLEQWQQKQKNKQQSL
ncbi:MAG: ParB/RepB/Spo0J family partition protein [Lachnospiraceae bacterium]|nr:ParB/RepB/Spo0J family partition protein [Lachnospiraceae bacterium]